LANELQVRIIKDQSDFKLDSALVVEAGGIRFVDRNDCPLTDEIRTRLRSMGVDLLLLQFSGAMWYPAAYRYPPARQREIAAGLRANLLDRFVFRANSTAARHVLHAAGPPCFLDEELLPLNYSHNGIFHDQQEVFAELQRRLSGELHLLLPGDRVVFDAEGDLSVTRSHPFDFSRKEQVIEEYRQRRGPRIQAYLEGLPRPQPDFLLQFKRHLGALFGSSKLLRARANVLVRFEVAGSHGGTIDIDLRDGRFTIATSPLGQPNYEFHLDGPIARLLVDGETRWEDVLLSMRFRAHRDPDEYNWPLFALLRYGHDARQIRRIEELLEGDNTAVIDVRDEHTCYTIQRYCPHLGEDLAGVPTQDGKLVCPRHGWTFDLRRDGECISGGNLPLRIFAVWEDEEQEGEV
jgi:UDP-MurNAc hydroxylase